MTKELGDDIHIFAFALEDLDKCQETKHNKDAPNKTS